MFQPHLLWHPAGFICVAHWLTSEHLTWRYFCNRFFLSILNSQAFSNRDERTDLKHVNPPNGFHFFQMKCLPELHEKNTKWVLLGNVCMWAPVSSVRRDRRHTCERGNADVLFKNKEENRNSIRAIVYLNVYTDVCECIFLSLCVFVWVILWVYVCAYFILSLILDEQHWAAKHLLNSPSIASPLSIQCQGWGALLSSLSLNCCLKGS